MDDRRIQFRVGVMVLATILIAGILVVLFGNPPMPMQRTYTVHIKFPDASGVHRDTPVRMSGILIGRVSKVDFDSAAGAGVIVSAELNENTPIPRSQVPRINSSFLGDVELQFVQGPTPRRSERADDGTPAPQGPVILDGEVLRGRVASDPLQTLSNLEPGINRAIQSLTTAGDDVSRLARNVNSLIGKNDDQISRIVDKTERAMESFQVVMNNIDQIVGDQQTRDDLKRSIAGLPVLLQEANAAVSGINGVVASANSTVQSANRNLENLEGFTKPLGERGEQIITNMNSSVGRLDQLLAQLVTFTASINNREGSLGQLLNDPELYQQLNSAAANINELTRELKPIVRDARVFTDKIARHPETLGVRGALKPNSGIK